MMDEKKIHELRIALRLTGQEFAHLMGVTIDTVWRWERGDRHPTYAKLVKLSELWEDAAGKGLFKNLITSA